MTRERDPKRHYYMTHEQLNPSRIVPKGPEVDWSAPHNTAVRDN